MSLESAVYSILGTNTAVAAIVSARIYPLFAPEQAAMPFLVYQQVSRQPTYTHDGRNQYNVSRVQITCVASTPAGARSLSDAVVAAMPFAGGTYDSTVIQGAELLDERDDVPGDMDGDAPMFGKQLDYEVTYEG
jgi:hypothetical protein